MLDLRRIRIEIVGVPGLEPGKAGPESAVLPLHHTPNSENGMPSRNAIANVFAEHFALVSPLREVQRRMVCH